MQKNGIVFQNTASGELGRITMAGYIANSRGVPARPMRILGSYAIVLMLKGRGFYRDAASSQGVASSQSVASSQGAASHEREILPGDLICLFPEIAHCYGPTASDTWDEFYLVFDGPVFDLWRRSGLLDDSRPVRRLPNIDYWLRRLEKVTELSHLPEPARSLQQVCTLQQVLADLRDETAATGSEADRQWIAQARALLETDLEAPLDLHDVARRSGMTYESFRKRFAELAGMPPGKYRMTCLIDRACELVHAGQLSNKEIAARLGFCDEFYFSKQFKRITGSSPRDFRRQLPTPGSDTFLTGQ
jgi:AraC-like DNA-binding protein